MPADAHTAVTPLLETRHVFLDTQVYHGLKHSPDNPALRALAQHVYAGRLTLHLTDVTLEEVARQLRETAAARARELAAIEKDLARWRHVAPKNTPAPSVAIDAAALGLELFEAFGPRRPLWQAGASDLMCQCVASVIRRLRSSDRLCARPNLRKTCGECRLYSPQVPCLRLMLCHPAKFALAA